MNGPLISQCKTIDQWKRCMYWRNRQCFWQQWYSFLLGAKLVKRDLRDNGKQEFEQEKHEQLTCCVCERWTGKTVNLLIRDSLGTKAPSTDGQRVFKFAKGEGHSKNRIFFSITNKKFTLSWVTHRCFSSWSGCDPNEKEVKTSTPGTGNPSSQCYLFFFFTFVRTFSLTWHMAYTIT